MAQAADPREGVRTFSVHARHEEPHRRHSVEERSFEAAAVAFVERWHPAVDADGDVSVLVTDAESGVECCFRVDLEDGETAPCG